MNPSSEVPGQRVKRRMAPSERGQQKEINVKEINVNEINAKKINSKESIG